MSREILFRGKVTGIPLYLQDKTKIGTWVYGSYVSYPVAQIFDLEDEYVVDPGTVGQFTGLCDKNGVKIFEGDVVASDAWCCKCHVVYMDGGFTLEEGETAENLGANFCDSYGYELDDVKVIGNIHDNPEYEKEESK